MKRYVRCAESESYQTLRQEVIDYLVDELTGNGAVTVQEVAQAVKGYDPEWCKEEAPTGKQLTDITKATRQLASLLADMFLENHPDKI